MWLPSSHKMPANTRVVLIVTSKLGLKAASPALETFGCENVLCLRFTTVVRESAGLGHQQLPSHVTATARGGFVEGSRVKSFQGQNSRACAKAGRPERPNKAPSCTAVSFPQLSMGPLRAFGGRCWGFAAVGCRRHLPLPPRLWGPSGRPFCGGEASPFLLPPEVQASSEALWRRLRAGGASVVPGFLSEAEEASLAQEVEPLLRRRRYEDGHWDGVIHKYRETEKLHWSKENNEILQRVRDAAFPPGTPQLTQVHVLDLHETGYIKAHVDSVKFCGCTIAGLSLLSSSVMRLVNEQNPKDWLDLLLERRSLYILRGPARYEFTHEILKDEESFFNGRKITRERRISVICRNLPSPCDPS